MTISTAEIEEPHTGLFRNHNFAVLWSGQTVATLGNRVTLTMLPVLVILKYHSALLAGGIEAVLTLCYLAAQLPAGLILDTRYRKTAMFVSDGAAGTALLLNGALLHFTRASPWAFVLAGGVVGIGWAFTRNGELAALPHLVPASALREAVILVQTRSYVAVLIGAPIGGVLLSLGDAGPFLLSGFLFLCSAACTLLTPATSLGGGRVGTDGDTADDTKLPRVKMRSGLAEFWSRPFVRTSTLLLAGSDFVLNGLSLVLISRAAAAGATSLGGILAFGGAGGIVGAIVARKLHPSWLKPGLIACAAPAVTAVAVLGLALTAQPLLLGACYAAAFFAWPIWNAVITARWLEQTPSASRARIQSAVSLMTSVLVPVSPAVVGLLLGRAGPLKTAWILAASLAAVAVSAGALAPGLNRNSLARTTARSVIQDAKLRSPLKQSESAANLYMIQRPLDTHEGSSSVANAFRSNRCAVLASHRADTSSKRSLTGTGSRLELNQMTTEQQKFESEYEATRRILDKTS